MKTSKIKIRSLFGISEQEIGGKSVALNLHALGVHFYHFIRNILYRVSLIIVQMNDSSVILRKLFKMRSGLTLSNLRSGRNIERAGGAIYE